ncbi:MAG: ubiquinone biosynthesis protein [Arenicella sp.]|jgi:ubiquinone biosynthesis protein
MQKISSPIARLWQIRRVVKKYGLASLLNEFNLTKPARLAVRATFGRISELADPRGIRIRQALEELGPVFVKLGQTLSTRPDLLPQDIAIELTKLQDQVPAFPAEQSMDIIRRAYGDEFDAIFESVEQQPLASASVAQVHAATLKEGLSIVGQNGVSNRNVIIKVLRPGIEAVIESDLKVMYTFAGLLQKHWSRGKQFRPLDVIKEYDHTIHGELDLRVEAANGARMGANFEDSDLIYVPRVYWDFTKRNVLVMERIYGTSIREIALLKEKGYSMKSLGEDGVETFFKQAFEDNFFHADMHAGNIFVSDAGKWIAIDFGIMGTLDEQDKQYLGQMLLGFFNRDYATIVQAHLRAGWVPADTNAIEFEQAIRVVCEPIFAKPISEISFGNVLMQLFQTVRRFEMPVQPQLVLLYKTLLNIEGLGRQLYPDLNLWDTAKPFLENWMKQQLSPKGLIEDLQREWPQMRALLPELPMLLKATIERQKEEQKERQRNGLTSPVTEASSLQIKLGMAATVLGTFHSIISQHPSLADAPFASAGPWVAGVGVILVLLTRQKSP